MSRFLRSLILLIFTMSCSFIPNRNHNSTPQRSSVVTETKLADSIPTISNVNAINFFGVKLHGEYADITERIYQLPILSCIEQRDSVRYSNSNVMSFSHTVKFCGIPCGMTVRYENTSEKDIAIHEVIFITSQTEETIIEKFVSEITRHYGIPDISDDKEDSYHWYLSDKLCIRARHWHAPEGGWTVFFFLNKHI